MKVATSIVIGNHAAPELAGEAVRQAMGKAGMSVANSVLLLLTSEFASNPQAAIKAAAKAANSLQVIGCSATGIFTEEDWVLDAPAAAAMVFCEEVSLQSPGVNRDQLPLLTLSAPNAINSTWLNNGSERYGGVSGDAIGHGPFSVWKNAKGEVSGYVEVFFTGVDMATKASHGLQLLTPPQPIQQVHGYDILQIDHSEALSSLQKAWKSHSKSDDPVPLHLIMATYADNTEAIHDGQYHVTTVISHDDDSGSITLAQPLRVGQYLSWGLRDKETAAADFMRTTQHLAANLGRAPDFGLLFSCLGRGPYFYGGIERDLKVLKQSFPAMPFLGFYGNGEIATIQGQNYLLPSSAVLSLFAAKND
jgi:small ligand-binding sensory domain FIST